MAAARLAPKVAREADLEVLEDEHRGPPAQQQPGLRRDALHEGVLEAACPVLPVDDGQATPRTNRFSVGASLDVNPIHVPNAR
ncbi:hypothetical protein ACIQB5_50050 [Streptomyces sp. NPDC088560]|uniref:hypothetical protein n=1 Tax=Streptomyces sp. NPDC088560 TaxID=3365868 RepID=UPI0037F27AAE